MEQSAPLPQSGTALTAMKGIGPARASRIQQALGIEFAEDLLRFSPEDIHQKLAANGPQVPRVEIQQWLIQALRLVKTQEAQAEANLKPAELTVPASDGAGISGKVNDSPGETPPAPAVFSKFLGGMTTFISPIRMGRLLPFS
ncbi:MAG: hypothetical protein HC922_09855 [Leptolyngbyaceae cyanobacterium SM2_3_12]|nr:hypothetical protein [Leptolyngbyaceae cyanobacterium SM2_3_12]